ncbi:MAG TPA: zinc ribbon domain-containing protein [Steroidobacteraceae bacterium]
MPFYEYQCAACGHHHEELQKINARPLRKCPACGRVTLRRLVSAPVFRLKGGGWYETDFKADKDGKRNIAGDKEPATAEGPTAEKSKEEKSEAKPAETKSTTETPAKPVPDDRKPKPASAKPTVAPARRRRRPARR